MVARAQLACELMLKGRRRALLLLSAQMMMHIAVQIKLNQRKLSSLAVLLLHR